MNCVLWIFVPHQQLKASRSGVSCYLWCRLDSGGLQVRGHRGQLHSRQKIIQLLLLLLVCLQPVGGTTATTASPHGSTPSSVGQVAPPTQSPHPRSPYRYSHVNFYRKSKRQ